ncbi:MAG: 4Fe-4S binding protein [Candidatus Methanoperedens sp.]|nr:4Fe-4S binding protein [Candidatus Methanoperedens sp.]
MVDNNKCIGCGRCAYACKLENHVPFDEAWYRTWVERYRIKKDGETKIDSPMVVSRGLLMIFLLKILKRASTPLNYVIIAIIHRAFRFAL